MKKFRFLIALSILCLSACNNKTDVNSSISSSSVEDSTTSDVNKTYNLNVVFRQAPSLEYFNMTLANMNIEIEGNGEINREFYEDVMSKYDNEFGIQSSKRTYYYDRFQTFNDSEQSNIVNSYNDNDTLYISILYQDMYWYRPLGPSVSIYNDSDYGTYITYFGYHHSLSEEELKNNMISLDLVREMMYNYILLFGRTTPEDAKDYADSLEFHNSNYIKYEENFLFEEESYEFYYSK